VATTFADTRFAPITSQLNNTCHLTAPSVPIATGADTFPGSSSANSQNEEILNIVNILSALFNYSIAHCPLSEE